MLLEFYVILILQSALTMMPQNAWLIFSHKAECLLLVQGSFLVIVVLEKRNNYLR